jgi:hypothetical protein
MHTVSSLDSSTHHQEWRKLTSCHCNMKIAMCFAALIENDQQALVSY